MAKNVKKFFVKIIAIITAYASKVNAYAVRDGEATHATLNIVKTTATETEGALMVIVFASLDSRAKTA